MHWALPVPERSSDVYGSGQVVKSSDPQSFFTSAREERNRSFLGQIKL